MQDDFDSGMGIPDDELGGGSGESDMNEIRRSGEANSYAPASQTAVPLLLPSCGRVIPR